jgi:hypothetical protein
VWHSALRAEYGQLGQFAETSNTAFHTVLRKNVGFHKGRKGVNRVYGKENGFASELLTKPSDQSVGNPAMI